jgi:hypothetical protein
VLAASRSAPRINNGAQLSYVERRRDELNAYVDALHRKREPWDVSVYEIQAELFGLAATQSKLRFRGAAIEKLSAEKARQAQEDLADYARLGGMTLAATGSPWTSSPVISAEEVQQAHAALDELRRHVLPTAQALLARACGETGLPESETASGWSARVDIWKRAQATLTAFERGVYELDLDRICDTLAPAARGGLARMRAAVASSDYKSARSQPAAQLLHGSLPSAKRSRTV